MTNKTFVIMVVLIVVGMVCAMISAAGDSWKYCINVSGIENCQISSDPLTNFMIPLWNYQMGYGGSP